MMEVQNEFKVKVNISINNLKNREMRRNIQIVKKKTKTCAQNKKRMPGRR